MPFALSMNVVTRLVHISAPIDIENGSTQYTTVLRSKIKMCNPADLALEYGVPVVSRIEHGAERVPHLAVK
jgi:hypothetical protein